MKKLAFSLLLTMICSTLTAQAAQDDNRFKKVQYNPETNQLTWAKKVATEQLAWNRKSEHDYHVQIPWRNNTQLDINMCQLAHIFGIGMSIISISPRIAPDYRFDDGGDVKGKFLVPTADFNMCNVSTLLLCTYRFIAGQQKWPFKVIKQKETITRKQELLEMFDIN